MLAAPAQAAVNHQNAQALLRLDTRHHLTRFTVTFVQPRNEGLRVQVAIGGRNLAGTRVLLNGCDDDGCRWLNAHDTPASGLLEVETGFRFHRDGSEDLLVRLRAGDEDLARVWLSRQAWTYGGAVAYGIRTFPTVLGQLRRVQVSASDGAADQMSLVTRARLRGPQSTKALLFAQPNLYADQIQARGLRSEHRLSSGFADHRLDGQLEMRGGEIFQVVGELRHRTRPPADGRGVFRVTLPRPLTFGS